MNTGATFTVRLPLAGTLTVASVEVERHESATDLDGIRILVVDDQLDARELLCVVLEMAGLECPNEMGIH